MCSPVRLRMFGRVTTSSRSPWLSARSHRGRGRGAAGAAGGRCCGSPARRAPPAQARSRPHGRQEPVSARRRRVAVVDVREHVVAGDAAAGPGARDRGRVEAVVGEQTAHHGREQPVARRTVLGGRGRSGRRRRRRRARARSAGAAAGRRRGRGRRRRLPVPRQPALARARGAASAGAAAGGGASAGAGAGAAAPASAEITASTAPTSTVSPSCTWISARKPAVGDGTSVSTLSVDTSKSTSSSATASPTFLNHLVIVPSVTVSPSWGIVMSAISRASSFPVMRQHALAEQLGQRRVRLDEVGDLVDGRLPVHGEVALARAAR